MEASIIIPFTRKKRVKKTIDSIMNQKTRYSYEIVIVSEKKNFFPTPPLVRKAGKNRHLNPAEARNLGAKTARGEYLLFLDDDCLAVNSWLDRNIKFLKKGEKMGAVGGKILGIPQNYFGLCHDYTNFWRQQNRFPRRVNQLYTASLAVKKKVFFEVGGFNEKFKVGEDVDFVNKLSRLGYQSFYQPEIMVFHDHRRDQPGKFIIYMYRNGFNTGENVLKSYRSLSLVDILLKTFKKTYFVLVIPMALLYTLACFYLNFDSIGKLIFLLPFVFLGFVAFHGGVAVRLVKGGAK